MGVRELMENWAQVRADLLATADRFSDEELAFVPFPGAYSVGALLLHIAHEEAGEVGHGVTGELREWPTPFELADYPSVAAIKAQLTAVHKRTEAFLAELADADLEREIETPWGARMRLSDALWHPLLHEIHHRGELSLMLGLLGRAGLDA